MTDIPKKSTNGRPSSNKSTGPRTDLLSPDPTDRINAEPIFQGSVDPDKTVVVCGADVFLLLTFYPNEAQPLSIIEALNATTPVIATNHASIPEHVFDGENGYLVDKKSPSQIETAIRSLFEFEHRRDKALRARQTYEEIHNLGSVKINVKIKWR